MNNWPCEPPVNCQEGDRFGDPEDCNRYYQCDVNGDLNSRSCPMELCFNPTAGTCGLCFVECQQRCPTSPQSLTGSTQSGTVWRKSVHTCT